MVVSDIYLLIGTYQQYGQAPSRPQESDNVLLQDIQLLILQKQQAMIMNPADPSHAKQVGILQQVRLLFQFSVLVSTVCEETSSLCCCHAYDQENKTTKSEKKKIRTQDQA